MRHSGRLINVAFRVGTQCQNLDRTRPRRPPETASLEGGD